MEEEGGEAPAAQCFQGKKKRFLPDFLAAQRRGDLKAVKAAARAGKIGFAAAHIGKIGPAAAHVGKIGPAAVHAGKSGPAAARVRDVDLADGGFPPGIRAQEGAAGKSEDAGLCSFLPVKEQPRRA